MVTYADKPWLKNYDEGVPHTLKPYPDQPVHQDLTDAVRQHPDRVLAVATARLPVVGRVANEMTYAEIDRLSDAFAAGLQALGIEKGDRVVIVMPNCVQFIVAFFGILKAGGVVVATNPTYPADKMKYQINDAGAKAIVTLSLFYNTLIGMQSEMPAVKEVIVTNIKEYLHPLARVLFTLAKEKKEGHAIEKRPQDHWFQDILKKHAGQKPKDTGIGKDDLALFQYTGGTTGVSKAAVATHGALLANTRMCRAWLFGDKEAQAETYLAAIPLFHVFGLVAVLGAGVNMGSKMILVPNARDIDDVLDCITVYRPTLFHGVPALYNAINNHEGVKSGKYKLNSIRACISGSAPLPPATKDEFERLSGGKLIEGFGMSEMPTATHGNPVYGENRTGSIGLPFPDMEIRIVSLEDPDQEVPIGEAGELLMHGPQIMQGYHNMPTETENVLRKDADGKVWLMTGDIARMDDDGYCYIVDRKKDMALIGGYNVYPRAVEDVLMDHPAVQEVGVAAIPHPDKVGQEALKAWVVLKEGESATEKELMEFAAKKLARYETPSRFEFVKELPRSAVGKILRRELTRMEAESREKAGAAQ